mmetsp:Transcript_37760/g.108576  ORF Transcript_37760/g.108576 Transcript_37760/m.108576 type:complete len:248 (-) Transcript_37760:1685-2428(-)
MRVGLVDGEGRTNVDHPRIEAHLPEGSGPQHGDQVVFPQSEGWSRVGDNVARGARCPWEALPEQAQAEGAFGGSQELLHKLPVGPPAKALRQGDLPRAAGLLGLILRQHQSLHELDQAGGVVRPGNQGAQAARCEDASTCKAWMVCEALVRVVGSGKVIGVVVLVQREAVHELDALLPVKLQHDLGPARNRPFAQDALDRSEHRDAGPVQHALVEGGGLGGVACIEHDAPCIHQPATNKVVHLRRAA